jgi:hypothetical protein
VALPLPVTVALLVVSQIANPVWTMAVLCMAAVGMFAGTPPLWTLPTAVMTGTRRVRPRRRRATE